MAKMRTLVAVHAIYANGDKEPIAPGKSFSVDEKEVPRLLELGAAREPVSEGVADSLFSK
jgi:hypothetical protein